MPSDIRIVKPTGSLVRNSPNDRGIQNITGAAHYGDILRGAELRDGWWILAGSADDPYQTQLEDPAYASPFAPQ